jgi:hypothetical protein
MLTMSHNKTKHGRHLSIYFQHGLVSTVPTLVLLIMTWNGLRVEITANVKLKLIYNLYSKDVCLAPQSQFIRKAILNRKLKMICVVGNSKSIYASWGKRNILSQFRLVAS